MAKTHKTSYGLEYKLLTPAEWKKTRGSLQNPYDKSIGDMHIAKPRQKRTITNIKAQRKRAMDSLLERESQKQDVAGVPSIGKYLTSQLRAYDNVRTNRSRPDFASRKQDLRFNQILFAADNQIKKLQEQGRVARAARKAQGLSVG